MSAALMPPPRADAAGPPVAAEPVAAESVAAEPVAEAGPAVPAEAPVGGRAPRSSPPQPVSAAAPAGTEKVVPMRLPTMRRKLVLTAVTAALLIAGTACARGRPTTAWQPGTAAPPASALAVPSA